MTRIKIKIPSNKLFETSLSVRIDDINYGNHMSNDSVLRYAHEIRLQFLKNENFSEMNYYQQGLIMGDAAVVYKSEAFYGDKLKASLYIDDITDYGFNFIYTLDNEQTNKAVAIIKTGMVFFNYQERKIAKTPEDFRTKYAI